MSYDYCHSCSVWLHKEDHDDGCRKKEVVTYA